MSFMKAKRRLLPRGLTGSTTRGDPARATGGPGLNLHARGDPRGGADRWAGAAAKGAAHEGAAARERALPRWLRG